MKRYLLLFNRSEHADNLFPSDDELPKVEKKTAKKRSKPEAGASGSSSSSSKKTRHERKVTMKDIFGTDSEDEVQDAERDVSRKPPPLVSYLTRRVANGHARQSYETKPGTHYIELKIYKCDEIERVPPMNRWRQAVVTVKNRSDTDTMAWRHISDYMSAVRKEFKSCPPTFINSYF